MNIHPLIVHFPIAFFSLYSVLELLSVFKKFKNQAYMFYLKAVLVILGCFGALAAGIAGKLAEGQFSDRALISLHSTINELASFVFAIIAGGYFISWLRKSNFSFSKLGNLSKPILLYENIVLETPLTYLLAIIGLILISIGGALGGAIVYGSDFDPFISFAYHLFFH